MDAAGVTLPALRAPGARSRILAVACAELAAFLASLPVAAALLAVGLLALAPQLTTRARRLGSLALLAGGFTFAFVLNVALVRGGPVLLSLPAGLHVTDDGLRTATAMGLRMSNVAVFALALGFSTRAHEAARALTAMGAPLARVLGARVHTFALQTELAVRFVPMLVDEARRIARAQRLRGLRIGRLPLARLRALVPLFVPVFAQTLLRASRLAELLAARGYRPGMRVQHQVAAPWGIADTLLAALGGSGLLVAAWLR